MRRMSTRKIKTNARKSVRRNYRNFTKKYNKTTCRTLRNRFTSKISNTIVYKNPLKTMFKKTNVNFEMINIKKFTTMKITKIPSVEAYEKPNIKLERIHKKLFTTIKINKIKKNPRNNIMRLGFSTKKERKLKNQSFDEVIDKHNKLRITVNLKKIKPLKLIKTSIVPKYYRDNINVRKILNRAKHVANYNDDLNNIALKLVLSDKKEREKYLKDAKDTVKLFNDEINIYGNYESTGKIILKVLFDIGCVIFGIPLFVVMCEMSAFLTTVVLAMTGKIWIEIYDLLLYAINHLLS